MPLNKESLLSGSKKILGSSVGSIGVVILLVLAAYFYGTCQSDDSWRREYENYRVSAQQAATQYVDSINEAIDSIRFQKEQTDSAAENLTRTNLALALEISQLRSQLNEIGTIHPIPAESLPPICSPCIQRLDSSISVIRMSNELIETQKNQISTLESRDTLRVRSLAFWQNMFDKQSEKADSLQRVIIDMPEPPKPPKLFFVLKINPNEAALLGTVLGIIIGTVAQ